MNWKQEPDRALAERVDRAIDSALEENRLVGGVIRVARHGALVAHRAFGFADREGNRPMSEDTPFRVASLTKPIVAVAALKLIAQGALSLDDTVERWIPELTPLFEGSKASISVRQLLTHTSGLGYAFLEPRDGPYHRANVSDGLDQPGLSLEENLARLNGLALHFSPGTRFLYSLSFDVLGGVLARAAGRSLEQLVAESIAAPLGLKETTFHPRHPEALATPYADAGGGARPIRMTDGIYVPFAGAGAIFAPTRALDARSYASGGAGLIGNAEEFHRFLEAIRTRHEFAPREGLDQMFGDQIPAITSPILGDGWGYGFGAGILRDPLAANSPMSKGAMRWGGAYGHHWSIDSTRGMSTVVLTNTAFEGMAGKVRTDLENAIYGL